MTCTGALQRIATSWQIYAWVILPMWNRRQLLAHVLDVTAASLFDSTTSDI